ncbi:DNA helicase PcrA [Facklamia hominis]|uniref:ATP-dependent DNA helicase n=1 Tax=Facklamia hominis CCUG 36813 TaxID=883111 RepID=K1LX98_9LACT|nr:DNA helicase PcrA [Facklamia hominis]EKB54668.1 ATP-dependent DNA helicase PcrA [Facklamia hominis CCUG 36813]
MTLKEALQGLNDKQREAVLTTQGPVLIAAGAGSGKTRVLTHRIAYLIEELGVKPWHILAITFTNKAANEMKERLHQLVGEASTSIWVSTFHALCVRILRQQAHLLGYTNNFSIVDQSEQKTLMKRVLKELNLSSQFFPEKEMLYLIDQAKNQGLTPEQVKADAKYPQAIKQAEIYHCYQKNLKAANAMDFNDLILNTVQLFEEQPYVRQFYQNKFDYIHVDEYQDTNQTQYQLVQLLVNEAQNICVVGDADQSIYGWRGADMTNILNFEQDFPRAKSILLEQNYRSTPTILKAANSVIKNNVNRKAKELWSNKEAGDKIVYYEADSDLEEAGFVIQEILTEKDLHRRQNSDFAVLYRTQAQSRSLEDQFLKANIPYQVVGGVRFYARKEIQDVLAYLRLVDNPKDDLSFNRIINEPKRGIGASSVSKLQDFAASLNLSNFQAAQQVNASNLSASVKKKFQDFSVMIDRLHEQAKYLSMTELLEEVLEVTGYRQALLDQNDLESQARLENIDELKSVTQEFDQSDLKDLGETDPDLVQAGSEEDLSGLTLFLGQVSLSTDQESQRDSDESVVTLMTLHAAKGLEFPVVFVVGMEEGIFPSYRAFENLDEMEEERRLAYVGMTRAEEKLYLSACRRRMLYGRLQQNKLSRFVDEVDADLVESKTRNFVSSRIHHSANDGQKASQRVKLSARRPVAKTQKRSRLAQNPIIDWQVGDKVDHRVWGVGTVIQVSPSKSDTTLHIAFPDQGIKQLLASLAPIEKHQDEGEK